VLEAVSERVGWQSFERTDSGQREDACVDFRLWAFKACTDSAGDREYDHTRIWPEGLSASELPFREVCSKPVIRDVGNESILKVLKDSVAPMGIRSS